MANSKGRPKGSKSSNNTKVFYKRVTPAEYDYLKDCLDSYRAIKKGQTND